MNLFPEGATDIRIYMDGPFFSKVSPWIRALYPEQNHVTNVSTKTERNSTMSDNKAGTTNNVVMIPQHNYRPSGKYPIQWQKLHPGSTFTIHSELSRGIRHSNDKRVYRKAINGNYAEDIITGKGCILMDKDLVQPVVKDNKRQYTAGDKRTPPKAQPPAPVVNAVFEKKEVGDAKVQA